jgi:hypothetical protein
MNISGAVGGSLAGLTVASTSYTVLGLAAALSAPLLVSILLPTIAASALPVCRARHERPLA